MSRHVSPIGVIAVALSVVFSSAVFLALNASFGGPSIAGGAPTYQLLADAPDAANLVGKSLVLQRGVRVGEAVSVKLDGGRVRLKLAVDPAKTTVYRDATIQVAHRTLFGEAYVRLDSGHARAGRLPSGSVLPPRAVIATVDLDNALAALDRRTRRRLASLADTGARIESGPGTTRRLNASLAGMERVLVALRKASTALRGQQRNLSGLVSKSTTLVGQLSSRDRAITGIVADGRATLEALSADSGALSGGVDEAGRLLTATRLALTDAQPLIGKAAPILDGVAAATPSARRALARLPQTSRSLQTILDGLPALNAAAIPALRDARKLGPPAHEAVIGLEPVLRNLVPVLRYIGPYGPDLVGLFGWPGSVLRFMNDDGTVAGTSIERVRDLKQWSDNCAPKAPCLWGDANGDVLNVGTATGTETGLAYNPFPPPGSPINTERPKTYQRVLPEPLPKP